MFAASLLAGACDRPATSDYATLASIRALGLAYLEEDQPAEAAEQFSLLASEAPGEALGPANLAVAELRRGDFDGALAASDEALSRAPDHPDVLFIRAAVLAGLGRDVDAQASLRSALDNDSLHAGSLWALSRSDSVAASGLLERIVGRWPENLPARMDLAERYAESGELDALIAHIEFVKQLLPWGDNDSKSELVAVLQSARADNSVLALRHTRTLHNLVRVDPMYGAGLRRLSAGQAPAGVPMERFSRLRATPAQAAEVWRQVRFVATEGVAGASNPILTDIRKASPEPMLSGM